jgi:predicted nuclease of predicted toxin-antitoxin system
MYTLFMNNISFSNKIPCLFILFAAAIMLNACNSNDKKGGNNNSSNNKVDESVKPTFKQHWGKGFTEIRRTFKNGLSFSDYGYQLEPDWRLTFLSDDSVNIYNPATKTWGNAPILFDHDSIFNIAWSYLRLKKQTKDSIIFQVMKVEGRILTRDQSVVYMTLYANDYIKNVLHTTADSLIHPSRKDSLFVQQMVKKANADTSKAFAGRQPAEFKSRNKLCTITRETTTAENRKESGLLADYLLPEYDVVIKNAYEDFSYSFTVLVDAKGKLLFVRSINFSFAEFEAQTNKTLRAIVNGYLSAYLDVTSASTLGLPHSSIVIMHVKGIKGK